MKQCNNQIFSYITYKIFKYFKRMLFSGLENLIYHVNIKLGRMTDIRLLSATVIQLELHIIFVRPRLKTTVCAAGWNRQENYEFTLQLSKNNLPGKPHTINRGAILCNISVWFDHARPMTSNSQRGRKRMFVPHSYYMSGDVRNRNCYLINIIIFNLQLSQFYQ